MYKKEISLGKVDFLKNGRKANEVTIEVELREREKGLELSICGNVWNNIKTDVYSGGQNYDTILELFPNRKKVKRIVEVWKEYHLNGMNAGTKRQKNYIKELEKNPDFRYEYTEVCKELEKAGLLYDKEENNYQYGSAWLFETLPENIIEEVKSW